MLVRARRRQFSPALVQIPGQNNVTWLQARKPGRYSGQCTEYCGEQHARMAFSGIAEPPDVFNAWWEAQLRPAPASSPEVARGERRFAFHCGACHSVRGTEAGGTITRPILRI